MSYDHTKSRVIQWLGIILVIAVFAGAYWYWEVRASTLNQSKNDLVTNGLVGLWSFNGDDVSGTTAYDRSGSGNNGTLTNGPVVSKGIVGQGLTFDGSNDYVTIGDPAGLRFGATSFSVSAWFKTTSSSFGYVLCDYAVNPTIIGLGVNNTGHTGKAMFFLRDNTNASATDIYSTTNVNDGQWHHVVGVRNASTQLMKLYLDGAEVASSTYTGTLSFATLNNWSIGRAGSEPSAGYFPGSVDETRIYSTALSVTEIQSLYTQGGGTKVNSAVSNPEGTGRLDSGLAAYWKMDDGSGTSATDSSVNGNTGTLTNGPTWGTGQIGGATVFDGTNDYISTAVTIPSRGTVSAWVNPTINISTATEYEIFSQTVAGNIFRLEADMYSSNNGYLFTYRGAFGTQIDLVGPAYTSSAQVQGWHHIVASWDTALGSKMYIDGTLVASSTTTTNAFDAMTFNIGKTTVSGYWKGSLDEARVYDRVLSDDEVSQLYRLTTPMAVDTGLKGYWSFDGQDMNGTTAYDRSGTGRSGTLTNGPTRTLGKIGQALNFDGTNDTVIAGTASAPVTAAPLTACLWMYPTDVSTNYRMPWSMMKNNGLASGWYLSLDNTGSVGFTAADTNTYASTPTQKIAVNTWSHVCGVEASSSSRSLYVNGVLVGTDTTSKVPTGVDQMYIGDWRRDSDTFFFQGKLDEVRVYNRALSAAEIQGLYSAGGGDKMNSSVSQNQGTGRLDSGLAGYWKLDDGSGTSATDASTNANTGTLTNGPTWGTGQIGGDVDFDGADDYITVTDTDTLDFIDSTNFTASGWFNRDTFTTDDTILAKSNGQAASDTGYNAYIDDSTDKLTFVANDGTDQYKLESVSTFTATGWHHYALVWDDSGSGQTKLYIDSVAEAATATGTFSSVNSLANSVAFRLGAESDAGNPFDGKLDEARLYSRALSADEVAQLYRLNAPTGTDTSLKGYWSFNGPDMNGTTAYDRSGVGRNGTLTNGPVKAIGKIGQGLTFDGTNDYVDVPYANIDFERTDPFTFAVWAKWNDVVPVGGVSTLLGKTNGSNVALELIECKNAYVSPALCNANSIALILFGNTTGLAMSTATGSVAPNVWTHVVATYDGSSTPGGVKIYVNGTSMALTTKTNTPLSTSIKVATNWRIGDDYTSDYFSGVMDEVRIYNRVLSADEVAALYNSSR